MARLTPFINGGVESRRHILMSFSRGRRVRHRRWM